jgi:hypothetical protein
MKPENLRATASGIVLAAFSLNAVGVAAGNPYDVITLRNVFGLRPIPVVQPQPEPTVPAAPRPEIKITGITDLLGVPRALFQYEDKEAKRVEFPPLLSEGQSYKELTVVSIDAENNLVRVRNGDAEMVLDFVNNGVKPPAAASVALSPNGAPASTVPLGGRVIVSGPTPNLPPVILARMQQQRLQEQQQAGQIEHSSILPP